MDLISVHDVVNYVNSKNMDYFFAKPNSDNKMFDGSCFDTNRFPFFIEKISKNTNFDSSVEICVSSIKLPEVEWRFFIVNKSISSYSQYRKNRKLSISNEVDNDCLHYVENIIQSVNPNIVYVIDICKINNTYKVIEYNTFNFSGFYGSDISKIITDTNNAIWEIMN